MRKAVEAAKNADVAVVFVGTTHHVEHEGTDRTTLGLTGNQQALIEAVVAANPKTVVVEMSAGPLTVPWIQQNVPALLQALVARRRRRPRHRGRLAWRGKPVRTTTTHGVRLGIPSTFKGRIRYQQGIYLYVHQRKTPVPVRTRLELHHVRLQRTGTLLSEIGASGYRQSSGYCSEHGQSGRGGSGAIVCRAPEKCGESSHKRTSRIYPRGAGTGAKPHRRADTSGRTSALLG